MKKFGFHFSFCSAHVSRTLFKDFRNILSPNHHRVIKNYQKNGSNDVIFEVISILFAPDEAFYPSGEHLS